MTGEDEAQYSDQYQSKVFSTSGLLVDQDIFRL